MPTGFCYRACFELILVWKPHSTTGFLASPLGGTPNYRNENVATWNLLELPRQITEQTPQDAVVFDHRLVAYECINSTFTLSPDEGRTQGMPLARMFSNSVRGTVTGSHQHLSRSCETGGYWTRRSLFSWNNLECPYRCWIQSDLIIRT